MFIFNLILASAVGLAADFYDEAYTPRGRPRAAFRDYQKRHGIDVLRPKSEVQAFMTDRPLGDSLQAWPVPLVLSVAEYDAIKRGVIQRASVIKEFLYDIVAGEQRIFREMTDRERAMVHHAFDQEGISLPFLRSIYRGQPKSKFRFLYGPDLIRQPDGTWVVLEDNIGNVGGFGDIDVLRAQFLSKSKISTPRTFMVGEMLNQFLVETDGYSKDSVALLETSPSEISRSDNERERLINFFAGLGIRTKKFETPQHMNISRLGKKKFVFILEATARLNMAFAVTIMEAFAKGEREFFLTPGIEGISNKVFLPFMDRLAKFYLDEDLELKSPRTELLSKGLDLIEVMERWASEDVVVKKIDGCGGYDVHLLRCMGESQLRELTGAIENERFRTRLKSGIELPGFVIQPRIESSRLAYGDGPSGMKGRIDLRSITYVGPESITPAAQPWGRAAAAFGNPRLNVGQGAMELVVLVNCSALLSSNPQSVPTKETSP